MSLTSQLGSIWREWKLDVSCACVRRVLPGYLDGALPETVSVLFRTRIARHLEGCFACRVELEQYRQLSRMVMAVRANEPPETLPLEIRIAVSKARATGGFRGRMQAAKTRLELFVAHVVEPLLVPVTGGALVALMVFGGIVPFLGVGAWRVPDPPTLVSIVQPARLVTLAGFPAFVEDSPAGADESHALLVEAVVGADGRAVKYRVIGGRVNAQMRQQLDQVVLLSRYRPQMKSGRPTSGGRVVLGFSQVLVRG
jgi:hypothetical protein